MELVLPRNYVEIEQEEMVYLDAGLSAPNWTVSFAINAAVNGAVAFFTGGGGGISVLKATISAFGRRKVTNTLIDQLSRFIAIQLANRIAGIAIGFILGSGGWSIGGAVANYWDRRDINPNNGWCDL